MASSIVDPLNSTIQALGAGETFLGQYTDIRNQGNVSILINGDVSAAGTLSFEFSIDRAVVDSKEDIEIVDITDTLAFVKIVAGSFFRVRYINGATPLASFRLQTQKNKGKNVGFSIEEFQATLEAIEINTSITANTTNVVVLAKGVVLSVASGVETTIATFTSSALKAAWITQIVCSGQENSKWRLFKAGTPEIVRRIGAGQINTDFEFRPGYKVAAGGVIIDIKVRHERVGKTPDFEATILGYVEE